MLNFITEAIFTVGGYLLLLFVAAWAVAYAIGWIAKWTNEGGK